MGKFENKYHVGDIIHGFLFITELPKEKGLRFGIFKCPYCGTEFKYKLTKISNNAKKSCGCRAYINMDRGTTHGHNRNGKRTPEYTSWHQMIQRCTNPNNKYYSYYGAEGVTVCDRWKHSFENFFADMGTKLHPKLTLDRWPNMKGNYEPGNCRWATRKQQMANTRATTFVMYNNKRYALPDICAELGLKRKDVTGWKWYKKCSVQEAFEYILKKNGYAIIKQSNFTSHTFGHLTFLKNSSFNTPGV